MVVGTKHSLLAKYYAKEVEDSGQERITLSIQLSIPSVTTVIQTVLTVIQLYLNYLHLQQLNIEKEVHENEDAVILPLSWLNNIQERGRIRYLHVHP